MEMDDCYIEGELFHITSARFHKQYVLLTMAEITNRDQVERLMRKEIQVKPDDLVKLPEGRFYIFELIGMDVYDTKEEFLGTIKEVLQPGANDVYVVEKEGEADLLLAAIPSVILSIDGTARKMIVDPPEWL